MVAFYNEIDPHAAAWLRELIDRGLIAPGVVDERSIEDIEPRELSGYEQVHFFAGIGVWSYALRRAGWPDDRPVWTGSCPCQPFSAAGKGAGFNDERHLWPHFHWLIEQCRPPVVFGEQVASKDGLAWLDLVSSDVEGAGYAFGAVDTCAAGFGAPHIRQRLYWVADVYSERHPQLQRGEFTGVRIEGECQRSFNGPERSGANSGLGDAFGAGLEGHAGHGGAEGREGSSGSTPAPSLLGGMADANDGSQYALLRRSPDHSTEDLRRCEVSGPFGHLAGGDEGQPGGLRGSSEGRSCPTNGFWRDADWLYCRDGKWRPVEPGAFPLAHGLAARVVRLRGYGNAINAEQAQAFIEAYLT